MQFFLRSADADVGRYLKLFTFLSIPRIYQVLAEHQKDPSKRTAQHLLAFEFVHLAHGNEAAKSAESQHQRLFNSNASVQGLLEQASQSQAVGDESAQLDQENRNQVMWNPSVNIHARPTRMDSNQPMRIKLPKSLVENQPIHRILWSAGLVSSKQEGHKLVANRGCHIGGKSENVAKKPMGDDLTFSPVKTFAPEDTNKYIIDDSLLILRIGKWKIRMITIVSDQEFEAMGLSCPGWKDEEAKEQTQGAFSPKRNNHTRKGSDNKVEEMEDRILRMMKLQS